MQLHARESVDGDRQSLLYRQLPLQPYTSLVQSNARRLPHFLRTLPTARQQVHRAEARPAQKRGSRSLAKTTNNIENSSRLTPYLFQPPLLGWLLINSLSFKSAKRFYTSS